MQVKFPMNENVWGLVVEQADEQMFVENQGVYFFVVEYDTEDDFFHALNRFDGTVEYEELI